MSTLALDGSRTLRTEGRAVAVLRYLDLPLLAVALPVFAVAGLPMLGYVVGAAAWLAQRGVQVAATRHAARADRRGALGTLAGAMLVRIWLISLAILLVGLAEREAGLAAAVLAAILFTVYMGAQVTTRLLDQEGARP